MLAPHFQALVKAAVLIQTTEWALGVPGEMQCALALPSLAVVIGQSSGLSWTLQMALLVLILGT